MGIFKRATQKIERTINRVLRPIDEMRKIADYVETWMDASGVLIIAEEKLRSRIETWFHVKLNDEELQAIIALARQIRKQRRDS